MQSFDENKEVAKLLEDYRRYNDLLTAQQSCATELAKQKLRGQVSVETASLYEQLAVDLQNLSDSMTFASPTIWMRYKYEAYQNETQPIRTMHDFRMHCSKFGYICTKRFLFVNKQLANHQLALLTDTKVYSDTMTLGELLTDDVFAVLELDSDFMKEWAVHEYHKANGRVAKWENFQGST